MADDDEGAVRRRRRLPLDAHLTVPRPWRIALLVVAVLASMWAFFSPDPGVPDGAPGVLDLVAHAAIFALLTALALWCFDARLQVVAALLAYAVLTEVGQLLLDNGRSASVLDAVADTAGIAAALWTRSKITRGGSKITREGSKITT